MTIEHRAHKSGKFYFIRGMRVGAESLEAIREKFPCWRHSKLKRLVRLEVLDFEDRVKKKVDPPAFLYFCLGGYRLVIGTPATSKEIKREYPGGIDELEHVIKVAA
jgi:hypothetical protein